MSAHTPGPWKVHGYPQKFGPYNMGIDIGPGLRMVARVCGEFEKPTPGAQAEANARLIAAAPDMLAVLKQIEGEMRAGLGSSYGETREQVRRAIAKAEGRL